MSSDDAVENVVVYHNMCWASVKQKLMPKPSDDNKEQRMICILSEIEIINHELRTSTSITDMNQVNKTFRNLLIENGMLQMKSKK